VKKSETLKNLFEGKRAVVFDFDNVLVDSEPYHYEAYDIVFSKRGHKLDRCEYWLEWTSRGGGAEGEIERYDLPMDPDEIRREKDPIYHEFCRTRIEMFPEAKEIITSLAAAGYTLAIASGSYERDIRTILVSNLVENLFTAIVGKDGIARTKPHAETYIEAARRLGIPPSSCLAVEDAEKGVWSAHGAGMEVIVVMTDLTRDLRIEGADLTLGSLDELRSLLREILRSS
jgi:HAD superfamily hydrolase (TIGR01509 family)